MEILRTPGKYSSKANGLIDGNMGYSLILTALVTTLSILVTAGCATQNATIDHDTSFQSNDSQESTLSEPIDDYSADTIIYEKLLSNQRLTTAEYRQVKAQAKKTDSSQLEQAIVTLWTMDQVKKSLQDQHSETEISLQAAFKDMVPTLPQRLRDNAFLQHYTVYLQALELLSKTHNSPDFHQNIHKTVVHQSNLWSALLQPKYQMLPSELATTTRPLDPHEAIKNVASVGQLKSLDLLLTRADQEAENQHHQQAIAILQAVPTDDPSYGIALARIREFSNEAVKELRIEAAKAFQNSLPLQDNEAKISYLEQAQKLLSEALEKFPKSDYTSTVQANMSVITKDLEQLQKEIAKKEKVGDPD